MENNPLTRQQEIFTEQVKLLYQQTQSETKSNLIPPLFIAYFFYGYVDQSFLVAWLLLIEAAILYKAYQAWRFKHYSIEKKFNWVVKVTIGNTLHCLFASFLFVSLDLQENYSIAILYCALLIVLSSLMVHILASLPYLYLFPCLAIYLPIIIKSFIAATPAFNLLAIGCLIACIQFIFLNRNIYKTILESITLRFEKNDLVEELDQKCQDAELANSLKTKFLAAASHDLRQPLHTMSLFLEILQSKLTTQEQQEISHKIISSNESLTKMLNTLLDISKLDANTIEVNNTHFKLQDLLAVLLSDFTPLANQKNLSLQIENYNQAIVYSDIFHLDRILRNLLSNAIKYTQQGGVTLSYVDNGDQTYRLTVSDTGEGIPQLKQELVFNEFYQLNNPERDRHQGLGLGLSIVRRLCHLLGSEVQLSSVEQQGTAFFFTVPKGDIKQVEVAEKIQQHTLFSGLKLLVIDDEPEILEAMTALLTTWQCHVEVAESSAAALQLLQHKHFQPEVIITDYRLRDYRSGIEAIDAVRTALNHPFLPAIVLTGDTTPEVINLCQQKDFLLLYKPIKAGKLLSSLNHCLKHYSSGQTCEATTS